MTTKDDIYEIPNIGCLLGIAYQTEVARLNMALSTAGLDITAAEYLILRVLSAKGTMQQYEISRILGKDKASISRSVQSLVKKRWVNATPVTYKCCMVSLTDEGHSGMPQLLEIAGSLHQKLSDKITHRQMENLREILEAIIK